MTTRILTMGAFACAACSTSMTGEGFDQVGIPGAKATGGNYGTGYGWTTIVSSDGYSCSFSFAIDNIYGQPERNDHLVYSSNSSGNHPNE